jgi:Rod binding domain-containing protein
MAVDLPTDLILDVARAADPMVAREAQNRLADTSVSVADTGRISRTEGSKDAFEVAKEFESLLVANMIDDMMGDGESEVFGGGFAGGVWKSMMAEQMANAIVKSTDFGVASKVATYFVRSGDMIEPMSGINNAEDTVKDARSIDAARKESQIMSLDFIRDLMDADNPHRNT